VDGHEHQASFALITRVRNYGGDFQIARRIKLTDADFEVVVFENQQWHDYVRFLGAVIANRIYKTPGVTVYRATSVDLQAPDDGRIYVQADGEAIGNLPAAITSVPDALTLLIPRRYAEM
jgi:diacylglycerol kinase (ATP)